MHAALFVSEHIVKVGCQPLAWLGIKEVGIASKHEFNVCHGIAVARKFVVTLDVVNGITVDFRLTLAYEVVADLSEHGHHHGVKQMVALYVKVCLRWVHSEGFHLFLQSQIAFFGIGKITVELPYAS